MSSNLINLPVLSKDDRALDDLRAEFMSARVSRRRADKRLAEIADQMLPLIKREALEDLVKRGIHLGVTRVIVRYRDWSCDEGQPDFLEKEVFVMGVNVSAPTFWGWPGESDERDFSIEYEFALVKKNGQPSKAALGFYPRWAEIIRIAPEPRP